MKNITDLHAPQHYTPRVLQFGEGNFLRCFVDWQLDIINEQTDLDAGIIIIRPIDTEFPPSLNTQEGLYTTLIRGLNPAGEVVKEFRVIKSVERELAVYREFEAFLKLAELDSLKYIFSNTTEAGIAFEPQDRFDDSPPSSFPAKLTRFLFQRYRHSGGDRSKGFILIPCELIDYNGEVLKDMVRKYAALWQLEEGFSTWLDEANTFCSTLVDRIVTGYPREEIGELEAELGYRDAFLTTGEYFHLFIIQGPEWLARELRLAEVDLNIKIVPDIKPYKTRKVGILNGAHTAMVPVGILAGREYVKECMEDEVVGGFIRAALFEEIIPAIEMDPADLQEYARAVIDRFRNPFIKHRLWSIALNSMTKFRTRILPQLLGYREKTGRLPARLVFALAALIRLYLGGPEGASEELKDNADILALYDRLRDDFKAAQTGPADIVDAVLGYEKNWQQDLIRVPGLAEQVTTYLRLIDEKGVPAAIRAAFNGD